MKKIFTWILFSLFFIGCGSVKQVAPSKYNPKFSYTPEKRTQISESSLTVAIIDPVFSDGEDNNLVEPYASFVRNMADDFEEVLNPIALKSRVHIKQEMKWYIPTNSIVTLP